MPISSTQVVVAVNNDKTGYALTTANWNVGKTGYSLTAASYVVRASSNQRGSITMAAGVTSNTATISSVTTTRATLHFIGTQDNTNGEGLVREDMTNATTVTATRNLSGGQAQTGFEVSELF